jgi:hypothetical protein
MRNELKKPLVVAVMMLAIISVLVVVLTWKDKTESDNDNSVTGNNVVYNSYTQDGVDETPAEESQSQAADTSTTLKRLTYTEALTTYGTLGTGYHYQFVNCQGTPAKLTLKKGTKFLLDNRDDASHKFTVGSQNYSLGKYGFAVVTARELGTYNILCDGGGAASIFVQQ